MVASAEQLHHEETKTRSNWCPIGKSVQSGKGVYPRARPPKHHNMIHCVVVPSTGGQPLIPPPFSLTNHVPVSLPSMDAFPPAAGEVVAALQYHWTEVWKNSRSFLTAGPLGPTTQPPVWKAWQPAVATLQWWHRAEPIATSDRRPGLPFR